MLLLAIVIEGQAGCRSLDRLHPERPIERPILNRFAHMLRRDLSLAIEISDSARNFQDPIISAGAQIQFVHGYANQVL